MSRKPIVAIVGRPNVGKSTFVNRIIGSRESIVDDMPGVTRDRIYFDVEWANKEFTLIDTGGIIPGIEDELMVSIYDQVEIASEQADLIVFLVDGKEGITPSDEDIANLLRRTKKSILLAVNKVDSPDKTTLINDFYALGIGEPYPISAMHGTGDVGDLLDRITDLLPKYIKKEQGDSIRIAVAGKPNVGKSSLINSLLGEDRVIVSDVSGTTRDAIDTDIIVDDKTYTLVDTAGLRKKARVDYGIEQFSVVRTLKAIRNCDVALLLMSAEEGITDQDKKISQILIESGKAFILLVNKWDLVQDKTTYTLNEFIDKIRQDAPHLKYIPILSISALTKQRLSKIFPEVEEVYASAHKKITTNLLNKVMLEAIALNPPPTQKGKRLRLYYATQIGVAPPTFVIFVNHRKLLSTSYERYIENKLREAFGFFGTPIRILIREKNIKE